jgi:hypothetical protein
MANPRTPKAPATNLDVLLEVGGAPSAPAVDEPQPGEEQQTEEHDNGSSIITEESEEVKELRRQLAAAQTQIASTLDHRPAPAETAEQKQIRELQDQLARANGRKESELLYEENIDGGILVHFLADGFTSNQKVFYRGQEVVFGPEAYKDTKDRAGNSWINLSDDEQFDRWGEVKFRKGPWPGKRTYAEPELAGKSVSFQAPAVRI